jgi:hypothetical protein
VSEEQPRTAPIVSIEDLARVVQASRERLVARRQQRYEPLDLFGGDAGTRDHPVLLVQLLAILAREEVRGFHGCAEQHIVVEVNEALAESGNAVQVRLYRMAVEGRQIGGVRKDVLVRDDRQLRMRRRQPSRDLTVRDEIDPSQPRRVALDRSNRVPQLVVVLIPVRRAESCRDLGRGSEVLVLQLDVGRIGAIHPGVDNVDVVAHFPTLTGPPQA